MALKRGRFSQNEMDFITEHHKRMKKADIAEALNRSVKAIESMAFQLGVELK